MATNFRKGLFRVLDLAVRGKAVEITYKGATLRLLAATGSKLSRAVRQPALLVAPDLILEPDTELMTSFAKAWQQDDKRL